MDNSNTQDWQPLSTERHAGWYWQTNALGLHFSQGIGLAAVNHLELSHLAGQFVLAIQQQAGRWQLVALLSLTQDHNAYVDEDGRWRAPYVPAQLRGYPFGTMATAAGGFVAAIDEASGLVGPQGMSGQLLLDEQGQPGAQTRKLLDFLEQLAVAQTTTTTLCSQLADAKLLKPWNPIAPEQTQQRHTGLYQIDTQHLAGIDSDTLHTLHGSGALLLAHAMTLSQARLRWLGHYHAQLAQNSAVDLESIFGEKGDDILKFNF